ncbi:hypothetical protein D018_0137B, partial [Vibrio parahaemolyticus VP2007-007]
VRYSACPVS